MTRRDLLIIGAGLLIIIGLGSLLVLEPFRKNDQASSLSQITVTTEANPASSPTSRADQLTSSGQTSTSSPTSSSRLSTNSDLPDVSADDWELILVNRDHLTPELNPDLAQLDNIMLDTRIIEKAQAFLKAAQAIDPNEHLISGYRSVTYQEEIYQGYIDQEMAADPSLSEEEAIALVQTYSQPAGASEHQTGLAMDMSNVDALNQSDPKIVAQLKKIAPDYGFVLRFEANKQGVTGIGYEDWHWRYVGVESAKYMTQHHLALEEYLQLIQQQ